MGLGDDTVGGGVVRVVRVVEDGGWAGDGYGVELRLVVDVGGVIEVTTV